MKFDLIEVSYIAKSFTCLLHLLFYSVQSGILYIITGTTVLGRDVVIKNHRNR